MMKIDDGYKDVRINPDSSLKQSLGTGAAAATGVGRIMAGTASEADFSMPGLLADFGRLLTQRQQLLDGLPDSVRGRIQESLRPPGTVTDFPTSTGTSILKGVSGIVIDNRGLLESLRQISVEIEFVERNPELSQILTSTPAAAKNLLQHEGRSLADIGAKLPRLQDIGQESFQEVLDQGLNRLHSVAAADTEMPTPAQRFTALIDKAAQTGIVGTELALWQDTVSSALDQLADDPEVPGKLAIWLDHTDPEVRQLAASTGRPELIRSWAAIQAWGSDHPEGKSSFSESHVIKSQAETLMETVWRTLLTESEEKMTQKSDLLLPESTGRAWRFENLLSAIVSRPEVMNKLLLLLPELMTEIEKKLQGRIEGNALQEANRYIAQGAPRWMQEMAKRADSPELIEYWAAAKASDLTPWAELGSMERQRSIGNLKELAAMFKQPEVFQTMADDSTARGFVMQVALCVPGLEKSYPALIQIFEEKKERTEKEYPEQEVWVRVSIETDHIGPVDLSFRLQDKKYLSIFTRFADAEAASQFRASLPEIRKELSDTALELKKIAVTQIKGGGGTESGCG